MRRKIVHGNTYYQLVRNYREGGKHRQEVIYHLGRHKSLASAISQVEDYVALRKDRIASHRRDVQRIMENPDTRSLTRKYFGGTIPRLGVAKALQEELRKQRDEHYDLPQEQKSWERLRELDTEWEALRELIEAYRSMEYAMRYEHGLVRLEDKLNKLLDLQREYR